MTTCISSVLVTVNKTIPSRANEAPWLTVSDKAKRNYTKINVNIAETLCACRRALWAIKTYHTLNSDCFIPDTLNFFAQFDRWKTLWAPPDDADRKCETDLLYSRSTQNSRTRIPGCALKTCAGQVEHHKVLQEVASIVQTPTALTLSTLLLHWGHSNVCPPLSPVSPGEHQVSIDWLEVQPSAEWFHLNTV